MLLGLFGSGSACKEWFISLDSSWDGQAVSCLLVRNASKLAHLLLPSLLVVSVKVREITLSWTLLQKMVGSGVWSESGEYMYVQKLLGSTLWFIKLVNFVALLWLSQFYRWGNWDSDMPSRLSWTWRTLTYQLPSWWANMYKEKQVMYSVSFKSLQQPFEAVVLILVCILES